MEDEPRFRPMGGETHVSMVNPPLEVIERERVDAVRLIEDPTTIGIVVFILQRPDPDMPERLCSHLKFNPIEIGAAPLAELFQRASEELYEGLQDMNDGLEDDG